MKIVITGGGTGGHVFPALAIAEELRSRGHELLYIGSDRGLEARLAPEKNIRFIPVRTGPVKNQSLLRKIKTVFQLVSATLWSYRLLRRERIGAVVGVGGYISVPVALAGFLLRIPVFLQEQNVSVGIANRFLGRISRRIFLGFPEAAKYFPADKCVFTGNPIRKEFFKPLPSYNPEAKTLLILGGSQGAKAINQVITQSLSRIPSDWKIIHQTGVSDADAVRATYEKSFKGTFTVKPFIENMVDTMASASVVVSRSGAVTVSELVQIGRPVIFVPFPRRGQNDQTDNARWVESHGGALVVEQGEQFSERFWSAWDSIFENHRLGAMAASFSTLRRPSAIATIGDRIEAELGTASNSIPG